SFPDHHAYTDAEIAGLQAEAERAQLMLVTTEKDLVRLRARSGPSTDPIRGFAVTLMFEEERQLRQRALQAIVAARHTPPGAAASPGAAGRCGIGRHRLREIALENGFGGCVGFLPVDAPVFQFLQRNLHPRHGTADIGAR